MVLAGYAGATAAAAQQTPAAQLAAVDTTTATKLVWQTVTALDQANVTGNYSVLRDLASPGFQANNSPATLAGTFQALRTQRVDLGNCLIVTPSFQFPPTIVQGGLLRLRGSFPLRPTGVAFDMLFTNLGGQWRLFGLAVVPVVPQVTRAPAPVQNNSTRR
jgi:hypothetical protein